MLFFVLILGHTHTKCVSIVGVVMSNLVSRIGTYKNENNTRARAHAHKTRSVVDCIVFDRVVGSRAKEIAHNKVSLMNSSGNREKKTHFAMGH